MSFKTEAFVLRSKPWREADRLYDLFTPQEGLISAVLKAAARSSSKLSGHLLPFAKVRVMIGRGRLDHLAGVSVIRDYPHIRTDLHSMFLASLVVELFVEQDHGGQKAAEFVLLEDVFTLLDDASLSTDHKIMLIRVFLWKFLSVAGWRPELYNCLLCRETLMGAGKYVPGRGIICLRHEDGSAVAINREMLEFLRLIVSADWPEIGQLSLDSNFKKEWLRLSKLFYQTVYERPSQALKLFSYG